MYASNMLSIVVPAFNEEANIRPIHDALVGELAAINMRYEIIFVNDGSRDGTEDAVAQLHAEDARVKLISLSRNFGHQNALSAGLMAATGDAVISIDCDLQQPVSLIPEMIEQWRSGHDVVYTVREETEGASWFKRSTSSGFYRLINALAHVNIESGAADFRLLDRSVVEALARMPESDRFLRGMVSWAGFRQTALRYRAAPRQHGQSGYSLRRMVSFALTGLTSFSSAPLRLALYLGAMLALFAFGYAVYSLVMWMYSDQVRPGWTSLIVVQLLLGGVQLMLLGVLGEYTGRIFDQVKGRPSFLVRNTLGIEARPRVRTPRSPDA